VRILVVTGFAYPPARPVRRGNPGAMAFALIGGSAVLVGTLLDWYSPGVSLPDIVKALDAPGAKAFPKAYFGWLMFVLLAVTVIATLFANAAHRLSTALRILSPLLGLLGAALACLSLHQLIQGASIFAHASVGLWLVLAGFVVAGLSGIPGPRRRSPIG
jgi:hypothetical protein